MPHPSPPPPEEDLMTVLRVAEELYQQDQKRAQARQEQASFRLAAAEMGLGDQYLRRAVEELQARRNAEFQRSLARKRRLQALLRITGCVVLVITAAWTLWRLTPRLFPPPRPRPARAAAVIVSPVPASPAPVVLQTLPSSLPDNGGFELLKAVDAHDNATVQRLLAEGVDANSTTASFHPDRRRRSRLHGYCRAAP